jgi:hypothetical protein
MPLLLHHHQPTSLTPITAKALRAVLEKRAREDVPSLVVRVNYQLNHGAAAGLNAIRRQRALANGVERSPNCGGSNPHAPKKGDQKHQPQIQ